MLSKKLDIVVKKDCIHSSNSVNEKRAIFIRNHLSRMKIALQMALLFHHSGSLI